MIDDLRDALSAAYDKVEETNDADVPGAVVDGGDAPGGDGGDRAAEDHAADTAAPDRARDEAGRFAKAEEAKRETLTLKKGKADAAKEQERKADGQDPAAKVAEGVQPDNRNTGQQRDQPGRPEALHPSAQGAPLPPPAHWLGAAKKHWDRLPSEVRESIAQDGKAAIEAQALRQAVAPAQQVLEREFGGVDRGLTAILGTWNFAKTQPLDFVKQFLQHHQIDPRTLAGEAPQAMQGNPAEPDPVLAPVLQRVQQLEAALQHVSQQPLIAQQNQIQTEVEAFGNAIAPDGKVAHPYFNDVKPVMAALMSSGQAKTLPDAYDMAVYANPQIRAGIIAQDQAKQNEARRRAAEQARGAAAPVTGAPGHRGPGMPQNETVGDSLNRAWERATSGARA
jgi:hypothetical protein